DHVGAERPRLSRGCPFVFACADRAQHDAAAGRPGQVGVVDPVAVPVDDRLLEPERVDQEPDQRPGVVRPQRGPDLRLRWGWHLRAPLAARGPAAFYRAWFSQAPSSSQFPAWTFRNSSASHWLGGQPASTRNSRARWAWSKYPQSAARSAR